MALRSLMLAASLLLSCPRGQSADIGSPVPFPAKPKAEAAPVTPAGPTPQPQPAPVYGPPPVIFYEQPAPVFLPGPLPYQPVPLYQYRRTFGGT